MKKLFPIALVVIVGVIGWMSFQNTQQNNTTTSTANSTQSSDTTKRTTAGGTDANPAQQGVGSVQLSQTEVEDEEFFSDEEIRPATELYSSASEAMQALNKAATDYDDLVLEQFAELGKDCSWCPELYKEVQAKLFSNETNEDEKSYFAEVLAISGSVDNVQFLVDAIGKAPNPDMADIFTEALEITYGGEEVVSYLGEKLNTSDETLQESVVAALTNHGSKQAIDLLYNQTKQSGDPDGYYSLGIGLGEVIPDNDSIPHLVEIAKKQDEYSHLAVKALLNAGNEGLKVVMDIIAANDNPAATEKLLTDAIDHVPYEEGTEDYLKGVINTTKNPVVKEFAEEILRDFSDLDELEN